MTKMILAVEAIKEITINPEKKIRGSKFFPGLIAISVFLLLLLLLLLLLCLFFFLRSSLQGTFSSFDFISAVHMYDLSYIYCHLC